MELFDYLKSLTNKNEDLDFSKDEIRKGYQPYMINRFVSMSEIFILFVNEVNFREVPKSVHYKYMFSFLPKRKMFFRYIKNKKDLTFKEKKTIAHYFKIGLREADEYIKMLDPKQIKEVLEVYRSGKNTIIDV